MTTGLDETSSTLALARQYLMNCNGTGDITVPKESLKLILDAFVNQWQFNQNMKRADYKKAQV